MNDWQKIKSEFMAGATLKDLAEKYNIPEGSLKSRHRRENWSDLRMKNELKVNEKILEKISEEQAEKTFNEIENIKALIKNAQKALPNVDAGSKEGLLRSIGELYKILGAYTKKTAQKVDVSGNVQVTPIFGDYKLNVQSDCNEKDTKPNKTYKG